jgi:hypothetical protein
MPKTRLYVECPKCHMQYLVKDFALTYSNGAYIENVAGSPEWQRLICPCQPHEPHKFKLKERARLHVFQENESEKTHFFLKVTKPMTCSLSSAES